ncbi:hypothetical protein DH09_18795 [Bacillaceae bacterium JMAK1]|nr:hypothetical protein DH09_18795 [Bacillaceae bacterium JMAK1]
MKLNHITYSVSDLARSMAFFENALGAKRLVEGEKMAYYDIGGVWFALNVQQDISRNEIEESYTHLAFTVTEEELEEQKERFQRLGISYTLGRPRDKEHEGDSIYFRDPDGHLFEFHTGSLEGRIQHYKDEKKPMTFTD